MEQLNESIERFNKLIHEMEAGYQHSAKLLKYELNTNCYSIQDLNLIINQYGNDIPTVTEIEFILRNYKNYKQLTFNEETLKCLEEKWPETYQRILFKMNN